MVDEMKKSDGQAFTPDELATITTVLKSRSEKIVLSRASHFHHHLLFNETETALRLLRQLLSHGALGELEQAEAIWRKHPELLTCYGTVYHPNRTYVDGQPSVDIPFHLNPGRYKYINLTYLQLLWVNQEYEEAKPIEAILGSEEVKRQFLQVFPDGVVQKYPFDLTHAKDLLNNVFKAVVNDETMDEANLHQMNEVTREALNALYHYAKPSPDHQIGLVFDVDFYLAALACYDNQANDQFKQNWAKHDFWCIRVEEWLAGCLGTGFLRKYADRGISNMTGDRTGCILGDGTHYFAFRRSRDYLPGQHFTVGPHGDAKTNRYHAHPYHFLAQFISALASTKKELSDELAHACRLSHATRPGLVK